MLLIFFHREFFRILSNIYWNKKDYWEYCMWWYYGKKDIIKIQIFLWQWWQLILQYLYKTFSSMISIINTFMFMVNSTTQSTSFSIIHSQKMQFCQVIHSEICWQENLPLNYTKFLFHFPLVLFSSAHQRMDQTIALFPPNLSFFLNLF